MGSIQIITTTKWQYHANVHKLLKIMEDEIDVRYWLLTDWVGNKYPNGYSQDDLSIFIKGNNVFSVFDEDFQLIWGVLSGSKTEYRIDDIMPIAESNNDLWKPFYKMQNRKSDIEIVVWDSSYTLVTTENNAITEKIMNTIGRESVYITDCLQPNRQYYKGLTVNEMLVQSGFEDDFENCLKKQDYKKMEYILYALGLSKNDVDANIDNARKNFPFRNC